MKKIIKSLSSLNEQRLFLKEARRIDLNSSNIIISLTSVQSRFHSLHLVLASLLNQTVNPLQIHLWLDKESYARLPRKVKLMEDLGVLFHEVEDFRSHKKLVFALREFPDCTIITVDDDVIYPNWWLAELLTAHLEHPNDIISFRSKKIAFDQKGQVLPYKYFTSCKKDHPSLYHLPIGCGGVLYPPDSLNEEVQNSNYFMRKCSTADDLWFKAMSVLNGTASRQLEKPFGKEVNPPFTQRKRLTKINVKKSLNDMQLKNLIDDYSIDTLIQAETYFEE